METEACPSSIYEDDCATRLVLDRIGDRWTVQVVATLRHGALRFSYLQRALGRVNPKVLTETLRALQRDGVILRTEFEYAAACGVCPTPGLRRIGRKARSDVVRHQGLEPRTR